MDQIDRMVNKGLELMWLVLGTAIMIGVLCADAWWHLFSVAICMLFYFVQRAENEAEKENRKNQ